MMTLRRLQLLTIACAATAALAFSARPATAALAFDTVVFSDNFEGFTAGSNLTNGTVPSTGVGFIWQSIGSGDGTISSAQSFGTGSKSLSLVRPGTFPRYWTYPNFVSQSDVTANTIFGIEFDLYVDNDGAGSLSQWQTAVSPGGVFINAGSAIGAADGSLFVHHDTFGNVDSGFDVGVGWQTLEFVHTLGPNNAGLADDTVAVYLTRHTGNSAGTLARTLVDQYTHVNGVTLGSNWRFDVSNQGSPSSVYIDNLKLGTVLAVPEPGSLAMLLAVTCVTGTLACVFRRRKMTT